MSVKISIFFSSCNILLSSDTLLLVSCPKQPFLSNARFCPCVISFTIARCPDLLQWHLLSKYFFEKTKFALYIK